MENEQHAVLKGSSNTVSFLDDYFQHGKGVQTSKLSKAAVFNDRFDKEDRDRLVAEMREFDAASDRLKDFTPTGDAAFSDAYYALVKSKPHTLPVHEIKPSHIVDKTVMEELMGVDEYGHMRVYTTNDPVAAALAAVDLEPTMEVIFDKLQAEQNLADQLHQQMLQAAGLDQQAADLDRLMEEADSGQGVTQGGEATDFQSQQALIQIQREQLQNQMQETADQLEQGLKDASSEIRVQLQAAMHEASESAKDLDTTNSMWGITPGALMRLPAEERLEMARRFRNERFRRIAQLFGPLKRMAFAEQKRRAKHSNEELYSIETGADLYRMLPSELLALGDPDLEVDFLRRFMERELVQYKVKGVEALAQGGIIWVEDGSGSMAGDREIWAKAVGLTLLHIAQQQKRSFYGLHFGAAGELATFDFRDPNTIDLDMVVAFAEVFFSGGTDFVTPLSHAVDLLREEFDTKGSVSADIVFCTDGQCGVSESWLNDFKEEQERLDFRTYGIVIGGEPESEPLNTICDGRVLTVADLRSGEDLRTLFARL
jgi:uncharacterized protein with von Willebrand factor type A (vWA) domain